MADSSIPTPVGITEEMIERAAHAMLAQQVGNVSRKPVEWQWENVLTGTDREIWRHNVRAVLEAALAGRTVEPVEPDWTVAEAAVRQAVIDWALAYWIPANNLCSGVREHQQKMASNWADGSAPFITARVREGLRKAAAMSSETCCDLHGEHCEPPADLCCAGCSAGVLPWTGQVTA